MPDSRVPSEAAGRCVATIYPKERWGHIHGYPCGKPAKVARDAKPYCGLHDPEKLAAKSRERAAKFDEKYQANKAREVSAQELCDRLGVGHPHCDYRAGEWSGGVVLTAEAARQLAGRLERRD